MSSSSGDHLALEARQCLLFFITFPVSSLSAFLFVRDLEVGVVSLL